MEFITTFKIALTTLVIALATTTYAAESGSGDIEDSEMMTPHVTPNNMNKMFQKGVRHGRVEAAFFFSKNLSAFDIGTQINHDRAILTGYVDTDLQKDLASQLALNVKGINEVINNIIVDEEESQKTRIKKGKEVATEAKIITTVESKYAVNGHLSGLGIEVNAEGDTVILSGTVISEPHKELAGLIATNIKGVNKVINELKVDPDS